jgi:hypothetical protein
MLKQSVHAAGDVERHCGSSLRGSDPAVQRAQVYGNWIRTVAWTPRAVIAIAVTGCG